MFVVIILSVSRQSFERVFCGQKENSLEIIKTSVSRKLREFLPFGKKIGFKTLNLILSRLEATPRKTFARLLLRAAEEAERERIREKLFLSYSISSSSSWAWRKSAG